MTTQGPLALPPSAIAATRIGAELEFDLVAAGHATWYGPAARKPL
jgi:hypothetical protein